MTKSELRKIYLEKRNALSAAEHAELSERIATRFAEEVDVAGLASMHCFISMEHKGEPDTRGIFEQAWKKFPNMRTYAPRINRETGEIDALSYTPATVLARNDWCIPEPAEGEPVRPDEMDVVIVPLVCADARGHRVGYGKGFYDRFLKKCRPDCIKVGLSFFPPVDRIDDVHDGDFPLDFCVTPEQVFTAETRRR